MCSPYRNYSLIRISFENVLPSFLPSPGMGMWWLVGWSAAAFWCFRQSIRPIRYLAQLSTCLYWDAHQQHLLILLVISYSPSSGPISDWLTDWLNERRQRSKPNGNHHSNIVTSFEHHHRIDVCSSCQSFQCRHQWLTGITWMAKISLDRKSEVE